MSKKRILYFMPDNPLKKNAGNKTRALQLLKYFSSRSSKIDVDFVSEKIWGIWSNEDQIVFREHFPKIDLKVLTRKPLRKKTLGYLIFKLIDYVMKYKWLLFKPQIPNWNTYVLQNQFNKLLDAKTYDVIIISYVEWATLVANNTKTQNAKLIIDTHDFMTAQHKKAKKFSLGKAFETEINLIRVFDESWLLSYDEQYIFSQFAEKTTHKFVPLMFDSNEALRDSDASKKYDIIYVASENSHNVNSARWFFDKVFPSLDSNLKFCVVGMIGSYIPEYDNVEKLMFVDDLHQLYGDSKIAICPMLSGTGIKVKTVEALSFGLPVICTYRGLDGLPQKQDNGCILAEDPEEFAMAIHSLLNNAQLYSETSSRALSFFNRFFELRSCYDRLDKHLNLDTTVATVPPQAFTKQ